MEEGCNSGFLRHIRTALTVPPVGPGLRADRAEGVIELYLCQITEHKRGLDNIGNGEVPDGRGGIPRPWR